MTKEEAKGEFKDFTNGKSDEKKQYKVPVIFARKSKKGEHIYAFNRDGILGDTVSSIILNISELKPLLNGSLDYIKISVMPRGELEEDDLEEDDLEEASE